jgi:hypothetical protein
MSIKKFIGLVAVFVLVMNFSPAAAQLKFGVKGGANINSVRLNKTLFDTDNTTGFFIGPMMELMAPAVGVGFDFAILYSKQNVEVKNSGEELKNNYLNVPLNLKWKFGLPVVKPFLTAGPYVGFRLGGDKIWNVIDDQWKAKSYSAGLNFGAGVEAFKHLQIGFTYTLGLTDDYSAKSMDWKALGKNCGWLFNAAILF